MLNFNWLIQEKEREAILAQQEDERAKSRQILAKKLLDPTATVADSNVGSDPMVDQRKTPLLKK